jgi:hypothetical protein
MSINLLKKVQENLGYPPLQKVDANTQKVKMEDGKQYEDRFSQAAIPAVLTALYTYSRADEGAQAILSGDISTDWTKFIFADHRQNVLLNIADYSGYDEGAVVDRLNKITAEAVKLIREQVKPEGTVIEVKQVLADSRNDILPYLPAELEMGKMLHNNTLDDKTNKMEGPVSSLMHAIGGSFSGSDTDETHETNISK